MGVAALVVAVPMAWAGHDFGDVPNDALFHSEISAIKNAGITTGCGGGNYCPTEFVRRDAMAAFMHRGYGRTAYSPDVVDGTIDFSTSEATDTVVGQVTLTVPGAGTAVTQFVKVDAHMSIGVNEGTPPFQLTFYLADTVCNSGARTPYLGGTARGDGAANMSVSFVRAAPPGPRTFRLCAFAQTPETVAGVNAVVLAAATAPFGSTGGDTLGAAQTPTDRRP